MAADIDAFQKNPTVETFEPLHDDILVGSLNNDSQSRIVEGLATHDVDIRVVNATLVDLATVDLNGALRWTRVLNIAAKSDPTRGPQVLKRTAKLTWMLLSLRAGFTSDFVDLSGMDLRDGSPIVGQAMNLGNIDFSRTQFSGGIWRRTILTQSKFDASTADGTLQCQDCAWGTIRGNGTLSGGSWVTR
jgi:hypothetical protein